MKFIKPVAYTILVLMWITIIGSTVFADSTQTNTSGSNTAIEGGYTSTSTTNFQDGSSSNTTSTTNNSSNSNIKSAPPTASSPGMNTSNNCAMALSGGLQTFSIGVSGGKSYVDKTCELIALSRTLHSFGMKISAISLLCSDARVFKAMAISGTPCPVLNSDGVSVIGKEATKVLIKDYDYEVPTYEKWIELNKNKKKPFKKSTVIHK